jgi:pyridoxamine 5'-phosphate oxidase
MKKNNDISNLRKSYSDKKLSEDIVDKNPFHQFSGWFDEVLKSEIAEPTAMILATASAKKIPSVRTVLLKQFDEKGFVFYTNYGSHKAKDLEENPNAEILFLWLDLERQVRITGKVEKVNSDQSEKYFHSRPVNSQIGAWASKQSSAIPNRGFLENEFKKFIEKFKDKDIPLPPYWGGFRIIPEQFEFWQGRESRLHDRICYKKKRDRWEIVRLAP